MMSPQSIIGLVVSFINQNCKYSLVSSQHCSSLSGLIFILGQSIYVTIQRVYRNTQEVNSLAEIIKEYLLAKLELYSAMCSKHALNCPRIS